VTSLSTSKSAIFWVSTSAAATPIAQSAGPVKLPPLRGLGGDRGHRDRVGRLSQGERDRGPVRPSKTNSLPVTPDTLHTRSA
jgi:hypothetical protein